MANRKIILIADGKLHLSRSFSMDLSEVFSSDLKFSRRDIFWEVEGNYEAGKVVLRVVNYHPIDFTNFGRQELTKSIREIKFENLNWNELQHFLWSWNGMTQRMIENRYDGPKSEKGQQNPTINIPSRRINQFTDVVILENREPIQTTRHEEFDVLYKDATIKNGVIEFEKKFSWYHSRILIEIENPFLIEEFDSIKFYFGKVTSGAKRFSVQASFTLVDNIVSDVSAISPEIAQINDELVDVIKKKRIKEVIHLQSKKEKSLIDADELFESLDGNKKNLLSQTSEEVISEVITWNGIRNGKQLQYLSGLKQSKDKKVLFSLKPHFGFMFTIVGQNKCHYCWELLNSHATYIWTIDNNAPDDRMEEIISRIQEGGRNSYKQLYKEGLVDQDTRLKVLIHSSKTGVDPFSQWKSQLEDIIR